MSDPHSSGQIDKTLLLFERDGSVSESLALQLRGVGWGVQASRTPAEVNDLFTPQRFNIALLDMAEPENEGVALANQLGQADPNLMIILMCSYRALNESLEKITLEHYDYLLKPVRLDQLELVIHKGRREFGLVQDNRRLKAEIAQLEQQVRDLVAARDAIASEERQNTAVTQIPGMAPRRGGAAIRTYEKFLHRSSSVDQPTASVQPIESDSGDIEASADDQGILDSSDEGNIISAASDSIAIPDPDDISPDDEEVENE